MQLAFNWIWWIWSVSFRGRKMELCVPGILKTRYFGGGKTRCSWRFVPLRLDNLEADRIDWICERLVKFVFLTFRECFVMLFDWKLILVFLSWSWFWGHFGIGYYDLLLIGFGGNDLLHFGGERWNSVFWVFWLRVAWFNWLWWFLPSIWISWRKW